MKKRLMYLFIVFFIFSCQKSDIKENILTKKPTTNTPDTNISKPISWYKPPLHISWSWQLTGKINTKYDVDLYDIDLETTSQSIIDTLHKKNKKVICYFSAGSYEIYRNDASKFTKEILGNTMSGWEDEKWIDIRHPLVKEIMIQRLNLAKEKNCDGVEPDNIDGYSNETGFFLTYQDQIDYNIFLAKEAHKRGLGIALKNDLDQVQELEKHFDFVINEQCYEYEECTKLTSFIDAQKPVLNVEYAREYVLNIASSRTKICNISKKYKLSTLILPLNLDDSFRFSCD
jgi:hypothetical protein